jgi:hypothetical protein
MSLFAARWFFIFSGGCWVFLSVLLRCLSIVGYVVVNVHRICCGPIYVLLFGVDAAV